MLLARFCIWGRTSFFLSEIIWLHLISHILSPSIFIQFLWFDFSSALSSIPLYIFCFIHDLLCINYNLLQMLQMKQSHTQINQIQRLYNSGTFYPVTVVIWKGSMELRKDSILYQIYIYFNHIYCLLIEGENFTCIKKYICFTCYRIYGEQSWGRTNQEFCW